MAAPHPALRFGPTGFFAGGTGVLPADLAALAPQLDAARQRVLGGAAQFDQAGQLLTDYRAQRGRSTLGRVLSTSLRLAADVDRLVIVAGPATLLRLRALIDACCHPYHNELTRAERGGQPRIYFAGDSLDNDALAGLVDLLNHDAAAPGPEGRWALVLVGETQEPKSVAVVRAVLLRALQHACGNDPQQLGQRLVSISTAGHLLEYAAGDLGGGDTFELDVAHGGYRSALDAAALLPAATLGIDVRKLLEGAAALEAEFQTAPPAENIVLRFAGGLHLLQRAGRACRLVACSAALRSLVRWLQSLRPAAEASSRCGLPALVQLIVDRPRHDRLVVGDEPLTEIEQQEIEQARRAGEAAGQPTAELRLARCEPASIGGLLEMLALAAAVENELTRSENSSDRPQ